MTSNSKEYMRKYQKENRDKIRNIDKKYRNKPESKQKRKEYNKEYRKNHKEEIAIYNKRPEVKEKQKAYKNKHKQTEEHKITRARIRHKRRSQNNTGFSLSVKEWKYAIEYFNNKCVYCGDSLINPHKEHFIPVTKGGEFTKFNILPCCIMCNIKKHDNDPLEWLLSQPKGLVSYAKIMQYFESL